MERDQNCPIRDTEICSWAGSEGCEFCYIKNSNLKDDEKQQMLDNWKVTISYIPNDIDSVHTSETCQFCKGEPNKADGGYAVIDLVHPEPEYKKGMFFGFGKKVRSSVGSLIPLHMNVCKECKKRFRMVEWLRWIVALVILAIGIGVAFIPAVSDFLTNQHAGIAYVYIIVLCLLAYGVGKWASLAYEKKVQEKMILHVGEHSMIRKMEALGWSAFQPNKETDYRVGFAKEKLRKNLMIKP